MKTLFILTAALLGSTGPAQAQPATQTVAVHYGDLDLTTPGGRTTLDHRLRQAVRTACGEPSPADLSGQNRAAACRDDLGHSLAARRDAIFASAGGARPLVLIARR